MKYSKTLVLQLNTNLPLKDIEDALFWSVLKTREHYGVKRTLSGLRFNFIKSTRELNVKFNPEGKHFWNEVQDWLRLAELAS